MQGKIYNMDKIFGIHESGVSGDKKE